jgi:Rab family protein
MGVGKSSILSQYIKQVFPESPLPTIAIEFATKLIKIKEGGYIKAQIWDTAGQEKYKSISRQYYKKADGILLLFDVNDMRTFDNVNMWINEIYENSEKIINKEDEGEKKESDIVIYLIGNKVDFAQNDEKEIEKVKEDNIDDNKEDNIDDKKRGMVTKKEKEELTEKLGVKYYEISCKWNLNIEEVMARIVLDCIKLNREKKNRIKLQNANLPPQKEGCCGGGGKGNKKVNKPIKRNKKSKK